MIKPNCLNRFVRIDSESDEDISSSEDEGTDTVFGKSVIDAPYLALSNLLCIEKIKFIFEASKYNWFDVIEKIEHLIDDGLKDDLPSYLDSLMKNPSLLEVGQGEWELVIQSKLAFYAANKESTSAKRDARTVNGDIVSETESENAETHFDINNPLSGIGKELIIKRRATLKRRAGRLKAKKLAEMKLLSRKPSKHVSKVLSECLNVPILGKL